MKVKPSEFLTKVRSLIDTEKKWTKATWARDATERSCNERSGEAVSFCISGAMSHLNDCAPWHVTAREELVLLMKSRGFSSVIHYNDHANTKHKHVLALIDKAIRNLRCKGK